MKLLNLVFGSLFVISAILQYNDPDPLLWVVIYLYAGFICFMAVMNRLQKKFLVGGIILFLIYAALLLPGALEWLSTDNKSEIFGEMSLDKLYVEQTREFFGLLICVSIFVANYFTFGKK